VPGRRENGSRTAKFLKSDFGGLGAKETVLDALGGAQVDGGNDFGLAVDALALAQVVVRLAAEDLLGQTRHCDRSYITPLSRGSKYQVSDYGHITQL
jgi:hypothetical protein